MPWNNTLDQFLSPDYDCAPLGFLAQNVVNLIIAEQNRCFTWWNNKWQAVLGYQLKDLISDQIQVGFPQETSGRGIFVGMSEEPQERDNYDQDKINLSIVYLTGNPQFNNTQADRYSHVVISSFYLSALKSLLQTAPGTKFTAGWPSSDGSQPPEVRKFLRIANPDANSQLPPNLGVQMLLSLELTVLPYPILFS